MKKTLLLILILICSVADAIDCKDMVNGEIIRLDQPGGSLESFHIQDQDGLGTCYANAASVILQSTLSDHPEVSYLQLSMISKIDTIENMKKKVSSKNSEPIFAKPSLDSNENKNWDLVIDGGDICNTINKVKEYQTKGNAPALCLKKYVNLESGHIDNDNEWEQYGTILESSRYMNLFQSSFNPEYQETYDQVIEALDKYKNFKQSFSSLLEKKKKMIKEDKCNKISLNEFSSVFRSMTKQAFSHQACFQNGAPKTLQCRINKALTSSVIKKGNYTYQNSSALNIVMVELLKKLKASSSNVTNDQVKKEFSAIFLSKLKLEKSQTGNAQSYLNQLIKKISPIKLDNLVKKINELKSTGSMSSCEEKELFKYFESEKFTHDWQNDSVLCESSNLMTEARSVIFQYKRSELSGVGNLLGFLTENAGINYHDAMMDLYAFDCKSDTKIKIPNDLKCKSMSVNSDNQESMNQKIISSLRKGNASGFNFCANIFDKPKSNFLKDECGAHGVALVGIKCEEGKYKYLVQNSWGKYHLPPKNSAITIEQDKGSYWFDDKSFFDSVLTIDFLEKDAE